MSSGSQRAINIGGKSVGHGHKPFVIAELSGNHNQSKQRALEIIEAAAYAGADAVKLQTYTADTMTLDISNGEFFIDSPDSPWKGKSLHDLYKEAHTPWEWHEELLNKCQALGMVGFSTPFDGTAVDFLESLNIPAYKIASFENNDIPLIRKVASTGKPLIISSGMASASDIEDAVTVARKEGCQDLILLKCTSTYPATPDNSNITTIPNMRELYDCPIGLSDHTLGIGAACASVALGACVIEKHLTLSRKEGGVDADFSLEPHEFKSLVIETKAAWQALGKVRYGMLNAESASIQFKRSLYIAEDVEKGDAFTQSNLRAIRPGNGLPPKYYDDFIGKKSALSLKKGTPLSWEHLG